MRKESSNRIGGIVSGVPCCNSQLAVTITRFIFGWDYDPSSSENIDSEEGARSQRIQARFSRTWVR